MAVSPELADFVLAFQIEQPRGSRDRRFAAARRRQSGGTDQVVNVVDRIRVRCDLREHAPWSILEYGFRSIIAPSYADIFYNNCFKNGILPVILPADEVTKLFEEVRAKPGYALNIDLPNQTVTTPSGRVITFEVNAFRKHCLVNGLDDIGLTLQHEPKISAFEKSYMAAPVRA